MKRTALILAAATAFDLGVMTVAAQAQQGTQDPSSRSPGPVSPGSTSGAAVRAPGGPGGTDTCIPRPGGSTDPCGPAAISDRGTQDLTPPTGSWSKSKSKGKSKGVNKMDIKIDRVNTIQACLARQGEVVREQGVQLCRIPVPEAPAVGNPTLPRPGGIPPGN